MIAIGDAGGLMKGEYLLACNGLEDMVRSLNVFVDPYVNRGEEDSAG